MNEIFYINFNRKTPIEGAVFFVVAVDETISYPGSHIAGSYPAPTTAHGSSLLFITSRVLQHFLPSFRMILSYRFSFTGCYVHTRY